MLFDLRSAGRRRTVKVVYLFMAVILGGGLVLFGVGAGNGFGGILNAFTNQGSGSAGKQVVSAQETAALKETRTNPNSPTAWGDLLQARWTSAGQGSNYVNNAFTASGRTELQGAATAWQHYISLTKSPDPSLAILASHAYEALGDYANAAGAWEAETSVSPTEVKGYECLAVNAYAAGETRKGDLASAKAVSMLPKAQQTTIKSSLASAKTSKSSAQQLAQSC